MSGNPTPASAVRVDLTAVGGAGGGGSGGSTGGAGGQANATLVFTGGGAGVTAAVTAYGGPSGAGPTAGPGGTGKALLTVVAGANLTATATGHGGQGVTAAGHSSAKTRTTGTSGTFTAAADTSLAAGQLIQTGSASAGGSVDGSQNAKAKVVIGLVQPLELQGQAVALESAAPDAGSTAAVLAANPNIAVAFGASPTFFAIDELGGSYDKAGGTVAHTTTETVNLTVDLTKLAARQDLVAGFYNATVLDAGFTSLTFTLTGDGTTLVNQTFTTVAAAQAFFTDNAMDLGSLASGALGGNLLTLQASFTLTTAAPGDGFYAQIIIGDPPSAATHASRFAQTMAGMGAVASAPVSAAGFGQPVSPVMLATAQPHAFA